MLVSFIRLIRLVYTVIGYSFLGIAFRGIERDYRLFYRYGYRFCTQVLRLSRAQLVVEGYEQLHEGENYIFVANHVSLFDIPAIWAAVGKVIRIRIIYKRQLRFIPIFGWALRCSPFIAIRRERPRDGMARIHEAVEAVRHGSSAVIFAEGTRSRSGHLLPFKRGAFMLAARAGKPIVPVTIVGSNHILRTGSLKLHEGSIRVVIGKPIPPPNNPTGNNAAEERSIEKQLMQQVYSAIAETLPSEMKPDKPNVMKTEL